MKKKKHTYIKVIEIGNQVNCDVCNADFTDSNDSGGFLFETFAYCPKCASERLAKIQAFGEEKYIKAYCPAGMSFREWVLKLRKGDNTIKVISPNDSSVVGGLAAIFPDGKKFTMT